MGPFLPIAGAALGGAVVGWALVRLANVAIARLWAIALVLVVIVLSVLGMIRGGDRGIALVVMATFLAIPALIGSVVGMVASEWRLRKE